MNQAVDRCRTLRLVLGDQLNEQHHWFGTVDPQTLYVVCELHQEVTYVRHHLQKIAAFFASMEYFAAKLRSRGHRVVHLDLDETAEHADLAALIRHLARESGARRFEYQRPDEFRLLRQLQAIGRELDIETRCADSDHFLLPFERIAEEFPTDRQLRMETFYRRMRRRFDVLMDEGGKPEGGRWNYDAENRKPLPASADLPEPLLFDNDVADILTRIRRHGIPVIGRLRGSSLPWPVNREQGLRLLDHFILHGLPGFGPYQDAMTRESWALHHSLLSFALNTKMLSPAEVIERAVGAYRAAPEEIPLASVEGFVRQLLGWREFVRGIYWSRMPGYERANHFGHDRDLPAWFWSGETRMACMAHAIGQSLDHAYAHHIQRLMVTGNFCLLAGIDPDQVDAWYLGIYIDALQWVELPNTRGMSQFADGGVVASKPYAASGNYIRRMGDYCSGCHYDVTARSGSLACPFNSLYWHFMERNRGELETNPRIGMLYRSWDRMAEDRRAAIQATAHELLLDLDAL